jgi:hypothetical protein
MDNEANPDPQGTAGVVALFWLLVGLAPVLVLLGFMSHQRPFPSWGVYIFLGCAVCNLLGGIGCLSSLKSGNRVIFGVLLGGFFFVLSWGMVLFQACSHMNI